MLSPEPSEAHTALDDRSQVSDFPELEDGPPDDPQLAALIKTGRLPNKWDWRCRPELPLIDVVEGDVSKVVQMVDKVVAQSWFEDDAKQKLVEAAKDVVQGVMARGAAALANEVDWTDLSAVLEAVYEKCKLLKFGGKTIQFPNVDMQLMDIKPEIDEEISEAVDLQNVGEKCLGAVEKGASRRGQGKKPKPASPIKIKPGTLEEEFEEDRDVSESDYANTAGPSSEAVYKKTMKRKRGRQNNYSNISKVVNGKKYARFGVLVPAHWRQYPELVRAGIRKSISMRVQKSPGVNCHVVDDELKFKAIEDVVLYEGSCKNNAIKYNINYSTMQNYAHRAMYVLQIILGENAVPDKVVRMLSEGLSPDKVCATFQIKRPNSQVRVSFASLQSQSQE